jgi:hypothetical protein
MTWSLDSGSNITSFILTSRQIKECRVSGVKKSGQADGIKGILTLMKSWLLICLYNDAISTAKVILRLMVGVHVNREVCRKGEQGSMPKGWTKHTSRLWTDWGKPRNQRLRIAGLSAEKGAQDLQNMNEEYQLFCYLHEIDRWFTLFSVSLLSVFTATYCGYSAASKTVFRLTCQ